MTRVTTVYLTDELLQELEDNKLEGETINKALLRFAREGLHHATSQLDVEGQHIKNMYYATKWICEQYKQKKNSKREE